MSLRETLERLVAEVSRDPRFRREFRGVEALIELRTIEGEVIYLRVHDGAVEIQDKVEGRPSLTLTASREVFMDLLESRIRGEVAVLTGRLRISGDLGLGERLYRRILRFAKR